MCILHIIFKEAFVKYAFYNSINGDEIDKSRINKCRTPGPVNISRNKTNVLVWRETERKGQIHLKSRLHNRMAPKVFIVFLQNGGLNGVNIFVKKWSRDTDATLFRRRQALWSIAWAPAVRNLGRGKVLEQMCPCSATLATCFKMGNINMKSAKMRFFLCQNPQCKVILKPHQLWNQYGNNKKKITFLKINFC